MSRARRRETDVPLIMLTARDSETDKIVGLELGADDYLTSPSARASWSPACAPCSGAMPARREEDYVDPRWTCRACRRPQAGASGADRHRVRAAGHHGAPAGPRLHRSQLLDAIHGQALESYERAIDAHVKNIRRKVEPDPRHPRYLLTVYGVGYRIADA